MDPNNLTQPQLADILKISDRAIRDMGAEVPPIPSSGTHRARRYDLAKVIPWLVERAVRKAELVAHREVELADVPLQIVSEARKAAADAALAEMKVAKERGEMIHISDYERAWSVRIQRHKEGLSSIRGRLNARLGPEAAAAADEEIRTVLAGMDQIQLSEGA